MAAAALTATPGGFHTVACCISGGSPFCWCRGNVVGSSRTSEIPIGQRWSEDSPCYPGQIQVHPLHAADRSAWFAPNRPGPNNLMYKGALQQQTSAGR